VATPMIGACAWVIGEYHDAFESPAGASFVWAARSLLARNMQTLEPSIQTQCVWAATKVYLGSTKLGDPTVLVELHDLLTSLLPTFAQSTHVDVSERATLSLHLTAYFHGDMAKAVAGQPLFSIPLLPVHPDAQKAVPLPDELDLNEPFFVSEETVPEAFAPVRADPKDPFALAATYKDDFGFLATKEVPPTLAHTSPATETSSSMFYLQSREPQCSDGNDGAVLPSPAEMADPLEQMRERLSSRSGSGAGTKYQVLRDEIQAPTMPNVASRAAPSSAPVSRVPGSIASTQGLPLPPEKELAELQGRLWSLCYRDSNIAVYVCIKSKNTRKQLLRIELRCERMGARDAGVGVSDVKLKFPVSVAAQEADAEGFVSIVTGGLQERSAKVKVNLALTVFLTPAICLLSCEVHYSLISQGNAMPTTGMVELQLPGTTFLVPSLMTEDDISDYFQQHTAQLLQAVQTVNLSVPGRSAESLHEELPTIVGRGAGLCHFHGIQQPCASLSSGQKFMLTAQPPAGTDSPLFGQEPLPSSARIVCLCRGLAKEGTLDLSVKVKACRKDVCQDTASHLVAVLKELVEGRLRMS